MCRLIAFLLITIPALLLCVMDTNAKPTHLRVPQTPPPIVYTTVNSGYDGILWGITRVGTTGDDWLAAGRQNVGSSFNTLILQGQGTNIGALSGAPSRPGQFTSISAPSADAIVAVGNDGQAPANGFISQLYQGAWTTQLFQYTQFNGIYCLSATDCWAAGRTTSPPLQPILYHWDGIRWSNVSFTVDTSVILYSVYATSTNNLWVAGSYLDTTKNLVQPYAAHWNGTDWTEKQFSRSTNSAIYAIRSNNGITMFVGGNPAFSYMFDGTNFTDLPVTVPGSPDSELHGVDLFQGQWFTTGHFIPPAGQTLLVEWFNGTSWEFDPNTATISGYYRGGIGTDNYLIIVGEQTNVVFGQLAQPTPTPSTTATPCPSTNFTDVHSTDYYYTPVQYLVCRGIVSGYSDNTFRPSNNTTRAQLSKMIVLAQGWAIDTSGGPHFTDVSPTYPFYNVIETAYHHGIISGYADGTFRPGANVTRIQLSKMIVLARGWAINTTGGPHFTDVPSGYPLYDYVETAYNHGIISGYADDTFRPGYPATRGQIAKMVYLALTGQ